MAILAVVGLDIEVVILLFFRWFVNFFTSTLPNDANGKRVNSIELA